MAIQLRILYSPHRRRIHYAALAVDEQTERKPEDESSHTQVKWKQEDAAGPAQHETLAQLAAV